MDDIEVVLRPNFGSQDNYEVLGCAQSASEDELTQVYRALSSRYHPQNRPNDPEASSIFVRVSEAYSTLMACDEIDAEMGNEKRSFTATEARKTYENKFGKFQKFYYDEGGIVGLPYSFALKDRFEKSGSHCQFSFCGRVQVGILRSWHLKTKIDPILALLEVVLTWGSIAACKSWRLNGERIFE